MVNKVLTTKLDELMERPNTTYNRGILHGFLLALIAEGRLENYEALEYLDKFREKADMGY